MARPTITVEVAFGSNPTSASPVWTDVTAYARSIATKRGRNYELGNAETGTLTLTLENLDGRFTPTNTSSVYYPNVQPLVPVRVSCVSGGTTYYLYRGFIERWPVEWPEPGYSLVTVTGIDGLAALNNYTFGLTQTQEVMADSPSIYFRLDETAIGSVANAGSLGSTGTVNTGVTVSQPTLIAGDTNGSFRVTSAASVPAVFHSLTVGTTSQTYEVWAKPSAVTATTDFCDVLGPVNKYGVRAQFSGSGAASARYVLYVSGAATVGSSAVIPTAGRADHVVMRITGTVVELFVNGIRLASAVATSVPGIGSEPNHVGSTFTLSGATAFNLDEYAAYAVALSDARITQHYVSGSSTAQQSFTLQTVDQRIMNVLDVIGWPAADRIVDGSAIALQATGAIGGKTALAVIQEAVDAELGDFFIDGRGRAVFQNRTHRTSASSVAAYGEHSTTNLKADPSFESGTTASWAGGGTNPPTITNVAASAFTGAGTRGLRLTATATGVSAVGGPVGLVGTTAVGPNTTGTLSIWVRTSGPTRRVRPRIRFYTAAGAAATVASVDGPDVNVTSTWTRLQLTATTGADVAFIGEAVRYDTDIVSGDYVEADAVQIEAGTPATDYVDSTLGMSELPYDDMSVGFDPTYIYNDITVSQTNTNNSARAQDGDSQSRYFRRPLPRTHAFSNVGDCQTMADLLVVRYADAGPRIDGIVFQAASRPSVFPGLLARELGDVVTVNRRGIGQPRFTLVAALDGIEHSITARDWKITHRVNPLAGNGPPGAYPGGYAGGY